MSKPKISLVICVWNTSHLLKRSIETYVNQDFPVEDFEVIVIDDNSFDDVKDAIKFAEGKINIHYHRLNHDWGMRGNTIAFNTGFELAKADILMESTPEILLPRETISKLYAPHLLYDRIMVSMKTYNLQPETQLLIDTCAWREDVGNCMQLEGFFCDWTLNNYKAIRFGTHQLCSFKKSTFYDLMPNGYPKFGGYGEEDPYYCNKRENGNVRDITIMQPLAIHQWHPPFSWWQQKGFSKHHNKHGHTLANIFEDKSGAVPEKGTRYIFDGGSDEWFSDAEISDWKYVDDLVRKSGCTVKF